MNVRRARRGNAATVGALLMTLLAFGALAVDLGVIRVGSSQLQNSLDSAAFSGVMRLDGTEAGIDAAVATAQAVAGSNRVYGGIVQLPPAQVIAGTWDPVHESFLAWDGTKPQDVNALRLAMSDVDVPAVLGGVVFGRNSYAVNGRTMAFRRRAAGPLGEAKCHLPLVVPVCRVDDGHNPSPTEFTFGDHATDRMAWGMPGTSPNNVRVVEQLLNPCDGSTVTVDGTVFVNNGRFSGALDAIADHLNAAHGPETTTWNEDLYGHLPDRDGNDANKPEDSDVNRNAWGTTLEGVIPVVGGCNSDLTGEQEVLGFAWAVIYDVGEDDGDENVWVQVDVESPHDSWGRTAPAGLPIDDNSGEGSRRNLPRTVTGTSGPQFGPW